MASAPASPPRDRIRVRIRGSRTNWVDMTPGRHTPGRALRRLTNKCKALGNLCLRTVGVNTLFSIGDDERVHEDVELEHDLSLMPAPSRPISPIEVLLVIMVCKIEDLISTVMGELADELVNADAGNADAKALASQRLTKKMITSVSATIMLGANPSGEFYGAQISAGKGGVTVDADGCIKFAAVFFGSSLPKRPTFERIFNPRNRTLQNLSSREADFLKLVKWPHGGCNYVIAQSPAKVCARSRANCAKTCRVIICANRSHRRRTKPMES